MAPLLVISGHQPRLIELKRPLPGSMVRRTSGPFDRTPNDQAAPWTGVRWAAIRILGALGQGLLRGARGLLATLMRRCRRIVTARSGETCDDRDQTTHGRGSAEPCLRVPDAIRRAQVCNPKEGKI